MASSFDGNYENDLLNGTNQLLNLSGDNDNKNDSINVLTAEDKLHRTSPNIDRENHKTAISQEDVFHRGPQDKDEMARKSSIELSLERKKNGMNNFGIVSVVGALRNELESITIDSNENIENGNRETGLIVNDFEENKIEVEEEEKGPLETKLENEIDTTRNMGQEFVSNDNKAVSVKKDETNTNQDATPCESELDTMKHAFEDNEVEASLGCERTLTANNRDIDMVIIDKEIMRSENEISQLNDDSVDDRSVNMKMPQTEMNSLDNSLSNQFSFEVTMIENGKSVIEKSSNRLNQESLEIESVNRVSADHESSNRKEKSSINTTTKILNRESLIGESVNHVSSDHELHNHEQEEAKESISSLTVIQLSHKRHSMPNEKHLLENALAEEGLQDDVFSNQPLPRRPSLPTNTLRRRLSTLSMSSTLEGMNDLLANEMLDFKNKNSQDTLRMLLEDSGLSLAFRSSTNDFSSSNTIIHFL